MIQTGEGEQFRGPRDPCSLFLLLQFPHDTDFDPRLELCEEYTTPSGVENDILGLNKEFTGL